MNSAHLLGKRGEAIAVEYLRDKGYDIQEVNWRFHRGCEIDIIATKNRILHFVEVKTRSYTSVRYGPPERAITRQKYININRAVLYYLKKYRYNPNTLYQIDCIAIVLHDNILESINHIEDILCY